MKVAVAVFGSTGSVGSNTVDVIQRNRDKYFVDAVTANKDVEALFAQCMQLEPRLAAMADPDAAAELSLRLQRAASPTTVVTGSSPLCQIAADPNIPVVMAAIVGFAGLAPTFESVRNGKKVLLANKEAMVVAGEILNSAAARSGAMMVPVDSEHNAIFQCLSEKDQARRTVLNPGSNVVSLILTASGGPFRTWSTSQMEAATIAEATNHPNWSMGSKISIDSATMMNKGLEIIEACFLFGVDEKFIEVVVHPQSVVHSMVRYRDGSILAQLGTADMRTPIANALAWPERVDAGVEPLDFMRLSGLEFEAPDGRRFPCLELARSALVQGGAATGVLNAANEVAVESFLNGAIGFMDIPKINAHALRSFKFDSPTTIEDLIRIDQSVRQQTLQFIECGLVPVETI
jgi:1-deoxy-D-xylulose-5-phosphate reductoisomerase